MNKTLVWIVIVVVILGGVSLYVLKTPKQTQVPSTNNIQNNNQVESQTYTNVKYGISLAYPKEYELKEMEVGNGERGHYAIVLTLKTDADIPVGGEGPTAITIDIYQNNLDNQTALEWVKSSSQSNFKLSNGMYQETSVDSISAISYSWSGLYEGDTVALSQADSIFAFSVTHLAPNDRIRSDFNDFLKSVEFK